MAKSKRVTPSMKALRRARLHRLFREYEDESRYFRIISSGGKHVWFSFAGHVIKFQMLYGKMVITSQQNNSLSDRDWVFLNKIAEEIIRSVHKGFSDKHKLEKEQTLNPYEQLNPRQFRLI